MMIRRTYPTLASALLLAVSCFLAAPLTAQEEPGGNRGRVQVAPERAIAYPLKYVAPEHAEDMLQGLVDSRVRMVADSRAGQLLVVTNDRIHKQITDLIAMFDVPAPSSSEEDEETRVIQLKHRTIESVLPAIHEVQAVVTSAISATNSLIAHGTPAELDALEAVVRSLDVEAESLELECWILSPDARNKILNNPTLASLERELAKTGLTGYGTLSHMTVRSLSGEKFRSRQKFSNRRVRETHLSGKVHLSSDTGARLSFELLVDLEFEDSSDTQSTKGSFSISTELKSQIGKLIVVGLAPTGE